MLSRVGVLSPQFETKNCACYSGGVEGYREAIMEAKMDRGRRACAWSSCVLLFCLAAVFKGTSQAPPAPEDAKRIIEISHKLENDPFDEKLILERKWAVKWLLETSSIHAKICTKVLPDFYTSKYQYSPEITSQLILSSGAFILENPGKSDDEVGFHLAGVEGVLKVYASILRDNPKASSKPLENIRRQQSEGKLIELVQSAVKNCRVTITVGK